MRPLPKKIGPRGPPAGWRNYHGTKDGLDGIGFGTGFGIGIGLGNGFGWELVMGLELGGRKRWNFGILGGRDGWMDWRRKLGRIEVDWDLYIGMELAGYWDGNWDGWMGWKGY